MDENKAPNAVVDKVALARAAMMARSKKGVKATNKSAAQMAGEAAAKEQAKKKCKKKNFKQNQKEGGLSKMECGFSH